MSVVNLLIFKTRFEGVPKLFLAAAQGSEARITAYHLMQLPNGQSYRSGLQVTAPPLPTLHASIVGRDYDAGRHAAHCGRNWFATSTQQTIKCSTCQCFPKPADQLSALFKRSKSRLLVYLVIYPHCPVRLLSDVQNFQKCACPRTPNV